MKEMKNVSIERIYFGQKKKIERIYHIAPMFEKKLPMVGTFRVPPY